ncbi:unnamed protein product [Mycena citricolor]|uniref:Uncharacterized protein n=1 Tax=Mycena citricolor TaxID=2018698 RepID=A0AAD2Q4N4_9AGAR|nr:unnamed protein product [Mycena citricolor]
MACQGLLALIKQSHYTSNAMPLFGSSHHHSTTRRSTEHRGGWFSGRTSRNRRAGGLKAALANPNTTHHGRREAKHELHAMGRSSHVPFMTKVKRTLGIRSTPRRERHHVSRSRRY